MEEPEGMRTFRELQRVLERTKSFQEGILSMAADDMEWWASGPPDALPWAGAYRGREGFVQWYGKLSDFLKYDRWEPYEYVAQGDTVVEFVRAGGIAKATGRRYESDIARVWKFRDGKIAKVRSFYDTAAYVAAVRGP